MTRPTPNEIKTIANVAGVPVDDEIARRMSNAIGPAFEGFETIAGTLPFDLEPAQYPIVQAQKVSR